MPLPSVPPGGGRSRTHTHFTYVPTGNDRTWNGWVAGPCHWFMCHTKGKTKPCLTEMTGGEVACPFCDAGQVVEEIGYQGLYREVDAKPVFTIVHDYTREAVDALRFHQRVTVGRESEQSDGVWITAALKPDPKFQSTLADRLKPADLTETLLRVWKLPDLVEWYRRTHGAPAPVEVQRPKKGLPLFDHGDPPPPIKKPASKPFKGAPADGAAGVEYDAVMERLKAKKNLLKPSPNGQHKDDSE